MSNFNRGHSIDASYQVSVHLAKWFQRRRFLEIDQPETRIANSGYVCCVSHPRYIGYCPAPAFKLTLLKAMSAFAIN
jgi:hypothetical protein